MSLILLLLLTLLSFHAGEKHADSTKEEPSMCEHPTITTAEAIDWLKEDEDMIPVFISGCRRYYSVYHCPSSEIGRAHV